jgi:hypothetical protein
MQEDQANSAAQMRASFRRQHFEMAVQMTIHEDSISWVKFHHCLFVNSFFFAGVGFVLQAMDKLTLPTLRLIVAAVAIGAIIINIQFWFSLKAGLGCLKGYKDVLTSIDNQLPDQYGGGCPAIDKQMPSDKRALKWGPWVMCGLWSVLLLYFLFARAAHFPTKPIPTAPLPPTALSP